MITELLPPAVALPPLSKGILFHSIVQPNKCSLPRKNPLPAPARMKMVNYMLGIFIQQSHSF